MQSCYSALPKSMQQVPESDVGDRALCSLVGWGETPVESGLISELNSGCWKG